MDKAPAVHCAAQPSAASGLLVGGLPPTQVVLRGMQTFWNTLSAKLGWYGWCQLPENSSG